MEKGIELICKHCNNLFIARLAEYNRRIREGYKVQFCSRKCSFDNRKEHAKIKNPKNCIGCNVEYFQKYYSQKYCNSVCASKYVDKNTFAKLSKEKQEEFRKKQSEISKKWIIENPERFAKFRAKGILAPKSRRSSKIERKLAAELQSINSNFKRHKFIKSGMVVNFDVDIYLDINENNSIWIESDGEYHFEKVHKNHDFEKTKLRDKVEEEFVLSSNKNILLIRIKNFTNDIDSQVQFVIDSISNWDKTTKILKMY